MAVKRFATSTDGEISDKRKNVHAKNTMKANQSAANVLTDYLREKEQDSDSEVFDVMRLNEVLSYFYVDARKQDGEHHKSPKGEVAEAVKAAIACGYRHIDCAWAYGNEAEVGQAIKAKIDDGTVKHEDLFITTKEDTGKSMPRDADGILILSDADYLDTCKEMELLVEKGLTKSIGVSNFNSEQLQRLLQTEGLKYAPVTNQVEVNPYILNNKLISFCREKGIVITAYSPLGSSDHPAFR